MSRKALLIGSALDGLTGVENDVETLADALAPRGFSIERCTGNAATRAGILAAYEKLIDEAQPGDAVVVYYSGHGGRARPPATGAPGPDLMDMQFIAPIDLHEAQAGEFRGITSVELSVLLARLTQKTDNATVILDCCHAARMSRNRRARVKALTETQAYELLRAHIDRLRQQGVLETELLRSQGNPQAVRIVACAADQSAYEYEGDDGRRIGMLTESLGLILNAAGDQKVSWATVLDRVRDRVLVLARNQRPEAEGPSRRLLFETAEDDRLDALRATGLGNGRLRLECAPLLGVRLGDTFTIARPGAVAGDPQGRIGDLTVDRVGPFSAEGSVAFVPGVAAVPLGARAYRVKVGAPALPVRLPEAGVGAAQLAAAVKATPLLRVAGPDEKWSAEVLLGAEGELTVADEIGPLHAPRPAGSAGAAQAVRDLKILAKATALRRLAADERWLLGASVTVDWGFVRDGARHSLAKSGATVHVGDPIYISVRNDGAVPVYASLIDIGVSGGITVLTGFAPAGVMLPPGREYAFGFDDYAGVLTGIEPTWPDGFDPEQARPETVLALVTSDQHDVSALEQDGVKHAGPASGLTALLDQLADGGARDFGPAKAPANRYDVHTIEFDLDPMPDAGSFLIDERPSPAARQLAARGLPPATVAVRIDELIVHRNRAVFGADIRVDAIVLTGRTGSARPAYRTRTERFSGIRNGEPLPLDRMLVYHGPAADYLDIALWVSRDRPDSLDLGALVTEELADTEVQEALAKLGDAMTTVPHSMTAAAVGVGAVVVNLAYRLLHEAVNDVIGLYRGSMLAHEKFGAGRHPASGVRRVQDFSLAYSIDEVP